MQGKHTNQSVTDIKAFIESELKIHEHDENQEITNLLKSLHSKMYWVAEDVTRITDDHIEEMF